MAITVEELKVIIKAETANANKNLKTLQKTNKKTTKSFMAMIPGPLKAAVSIGVLIRVGRDMIRAAEEQEQAEAKLNSAILATGRAGQISAVQLKDLASELQQVTLFGDEATISALAMTQQLADLNQDQLKRITPLIQDFSAAMGVDLNTAANLVGKTLGSTTNALSRYGIVVDQTLSKSEEFDALVGQLDSKFGGMARSIADTSSGALTQFKNILGDVQEVGGGLILDWMEPFIRKMTEVTSATLKGWKAQQNLNKAQKGIATSVDEWQGAIEAMKPKIREQRLSIAKLGKQMDDNTDIINTNAAAASAGDGIAAGMINTAREQNRVIADNITTGKELLEGLLKTNAGYILNRDHVKQVTENVNAATVSNLEYAGSLEEVTTMLEAYIKTVAESPTGPGPSEGFPSVVTFPALENVKTELGPSGIGGMIEAWKAGMAEIEASHVRVADLMVDLTMAGIEGAEAFRNAMIGALQDIAREILAKAAIWALASLFTGGVAGPLSAFALNPSAAGIGGGAPRGFGNNQIFNFNGSFFADDSFIAKAGKRFNRNKSNY